MKFLALFALIAAVGAASINKPLADNIELQQIIEAIQSPSTDPATAVLLEEMLHALLAESSPIHVGPAIVESNPAAPHPLPAIVEPVQPVEAAEPAASSSPALVQIILNINAAAADVPAAIAPSPVVVPEVPETVSVVDTVVEPVQVVDTVVNPEPVIVVQPSPAITIPEILG